MLFVDAMKHQNSFFYCKWGLHLAWYHSLAPQIVVRLVFNNNGSDDHRSLGHISLLSILY